MSWLSWLKMAYFKRQYLDTLESSSWTRRALQSLVEALLEMPKAIFETQTNQKQFIPCTPDSAPTIPLFQTATGPHPISTRTMRRGTRMVKLYVPIFFKKGKVRLSLAIKMQKMFMMFSIRKSIPLPYMNSIIYVIKSSEFGLNWYWNAFWTGFGTRKSVACCINGNPESLQPSNSKNVVRALLISVTRRHAVTYVTSGKENQVEHDDAEVCH